ncbi:hypothetical protein Bbelb_142300 [Branchiostoma belcheri]|nr:hypothetical protein Bbelb_142300 [Branchiostoma belcheri]
MYISQNPFLCDCKIKWIARLRRCVWEHRDEGCVDAGFRRVRKCMLANCNFHPSGIVVILDTRDYFNSGSVRALKGDLLLSCDSPQELRGKLLKDVTLPTCASPSASVTPRRVAGQDSASAETGCVSSDWNSLPGPVVVAPNVESGPGWRPARLSLDLPPPITAPLAGLSGGNQDDDDESYCISANEGCYCRSIHLEILSFCGYTRTLFSVTTRSSGSLVCGDVCGNTGMKAALTLLCRNENTLLRCDSPQELRGKLLKDVALPTCASPSASVTPGLAVNHAPNTAEQDRTEIQVPNTSIRTVSISKPSLSKTWKENIIPILGVALAIIVVAIIAFHLGSHRRRTRGVLRQARGPASGEPRRRRRHHEDDDNFIEMVDRRGSSGDSPSNSRSVGRGSARLTVPSREGRAATLHQTSVV